VSALAGVNRLCLERLLAVAARDTGQSRIVANFLLAWWNAGSCGGFDLTELWGLDLDLQRDCMQVLGFICVYRHYPDDIGYANQFDALVRQWRANLLKASA
jgi:hypothetical protein